MRRQNAITTRMNDEVKGCAQFCGPFSNRQATKVGSFDGAVDLSDVHWRCVSGSVD